jgi:ElaB/YqjD/DUF883 family membrane-anchored ribosome-binding protein
MAVEVLERQQATVDDVLREVSRIKSLVVDAVEDGVKTALRTVKQGREITEDTIDDARYAIKRNPFQVVGIVFAAGVVIGSIVTLITSHRD